MRSAVSSLGGVPPTHGGRIVRALRASPTLLAILLVGRVALAVRLGCSFPSPPFVTNDSLG